MAWDSCTRPAVRLSGRHSRWASNHACLAGANAPCRTHYLLRLWLFGTRLDLSDPKVNLADEGSRPYIVEDVVKDMQMAFRTTGNPQSTYNQLSLLFPFTGASE